MLSPFQRSLKELRNLRPRPTRRTTCRSRRIPFRLVRGRCRATRRASSGWARSQGLNSTGRTAGGRPRFPETSNVQQRLAGRPAGRSRRASMPGKLLSVRGRPARVRNRLLRHNSAARDRGGRQACARQVIGRGLRAFGKAVLRLISGIGSVRGRRRHPVRRVALGEGRRGHKHCRQGQDGRERRTAEQEARCGELWAMAEHGGSPSGRRAPGWPRNIRDHGPSDLGSWWPALYGSLRKLVPASRPARLCGRGVGRCCSPASAAGAAAQMTLLSRAGGPRGWSRNLGHSQCSGHRPPILARITMSLTWTRTRSRMVADVARTPGHAGHAVAGTPVAVPGWPAHHAGRRSCR